MAAERILVVDDEDAIREIVCSMLTAANYKTKQASSGLKALAMLDAGEKRHLGRERRLVDADDARPQSRQRPAPSPGAAAEIEANLARAGASANEGQGFP